jgi:hypothetical protein
MAKRHPNQVKTQFKPGNPGGVINETARARRAFRTAFDVIVGSDKPFGSMLKADPKDTPARALAKATVRDAIMGDDKQCSAARAMVKDMYCNRAPQGVYASDEDGNEKADPVDPVAIAARLAALGVTLPAELMPRTTKENTGV